MTAVATLRYSVLAFVALACLLAAVSLAVAQTPEPSGNGTGDGDGDDPVAGGEEAPEPVPGSVYSVVAVDRSGTVLHVDAGWHQGVIEGMRFRLLQGTNEVARAEVWWSREEECVVRVVPGSLTDRVRPGDTAELLPYVPPVRPPGGTAPPRGDAVIPPDGDTQPVVPPAGDLDDRSRDELLDIISQLQNENYRLTRNVVDANRDRQDYFSRAVAAESELEDAGTLAEELRRQQLRNHSEIQRSLTLGFGAFGGSTIGDPLFGSFSLGPERFAAVAGGSVDVFALGPVDGFRLGFDLVEQPGIGPRGSGQSVLRATFRLEAYLPVRPFGANTALVFGYRHHTFPLQWRGFDDGGELVFSWGRRVPMTLAREQESFWSYDFRPVIEIVHAPYGGTGTDIRLGIGFPDLIVATINFNWSYFTNTNRFGAIHVAARVPVIQEHNDAFSLLLILSGDWVQPLDSAAYDHVLQAGLRLEFNFGR